nr:GGDEF domain-containing protein [uncultured Sphaerochaeta sp.]
MRITKKVFIDLAIWMMGFGMLVGIIFPFFMILLGMERSLAFTWWFFTVCIAAGLFVGAVNILLAHNIVGSRLIKLSRHMLKIEEHIKEVSGREDVLDCTPENCHIPVDSEDVIGASSQAFNTLVDTLSSSMRLEKEIRSFTRMLTSCLETDQLCKTALNSMMKMFSIDGGSILVETGGELVPVAAVALRQHEALGKNSIVLSSMQSLHRSTISIPDGLFLDGVITAFRPSQVIVQPIVYKQVPLGVLVFARALPIAQEAIDTIELFSNSLALALHNAITHDQVQMLAAIDPLTGLYNRRFGLTRLHEEFVRTIKQDGSLGLLMMDIDKFKQVNDTYGHTVGDRVLQAVATTARSQLREGDILVRLGGDEFLVLLIGAGKEDSIEIAESIRRKIENKRVTYGDQEIHVTVSIGGVSFPEKDAEHEGELIEIADRALYLVKESGRNRASL